MEFWNTIAVLARRKWVIIPAVLTAISVGAIAYLSTPVRYVSSTTLVLTTNAYGGTESRDPEAPTNLTNPLLNFNDALTTASAILIQTMGTREVAATLGARGSTTFTVNDGRTNPNLLGLNGPFVYMVGESTSPDRARAVVVQAQALVQEKLQAWQSALKAPEKTYLTLADVVPPSAATPDRARRTKVGLLALVAGFVLSMGAAYSRERIKSARQRSGSAAEQAPIGSSWTFDNHPERKRDRPLSAPPTPVRATSDEETVPAGPGVSQSGWSSLFSTSRAGGSGNP